MIRTKAVQLYTMDFPNSPEFAECLTTLGILYLESGRKREAVDKVKAARQIYERLGRQNEIDQYDQLLQHLNS